MPSLPEDDYLRLAAGFSDMPIGVAYFFLQSEDNGATGVNNLNIILLRDMVGAWRLSVCSEQDSRVV